MSAIIETADGEIRSPQVHDDGAFCCLPPLFRRLFSLLNRLDAITPENDRCCVECGGYCAAVERIRQLARSHCACHRTSRCGTKSQSSPEQRARRPGRPVCRIRHHTNTTITGTGRARCWR